jgi:hypothetical protein
MHRRFWDVASMPHYNFSLDRQQQQKPRNQHNQYPQQDAATAAQSPDIRPPMTDVDNFGFSGFGF